jgi:hypothetical protein
VVWLKIGKLQKLLLFLILEEDNNQGRRIPIWIAVQRKFGLEYKTYRSKKKQKELFEEERKFRHAYERLVVMGFVVSLWSAETGFSFVPLDGRSCDFCILTPKGLLVAERLKLQDQMLKEEGDAVEVVWRGLDQFCVWGYRYVTAKQVREILWTNSFLRLDNDRRTFDRYWTKNRLGKILQKCGLSSRSRISNRDGRRKYDLTLTKTRPFDDTTQK